ncbi:MAG: hypothetical protein ACK5YR_23730, partial [Pirellula sp.]
MARKTSYRATSKLTLRAWDNKQHPQRDAASIAEVAWQRTTPLVEVLTSNGKTKQLERCLVP